MNSWKMMEKRVKFITSEGPTRWQNDFFNPQGARRIFFKWDL